MVLRPTVPARVRHERRPPWNVTFLLLSFLGHAVLMGALTVLLPLLPQSEQDRKKKDAESLTMVIFQPEEEEEPEVEEPEPEPVFDGQIVELAPPEVEVVPDEADYLSEYDNTVEQETRTEKFKINPEVLAKQFSREQQAEQADAIDLNVDKPSTGAMVGNQRFDPDRDGSLAALPSPWKVTNKEGTQDPIPSSQRNAALSGAPQNDMLDEEIGDVVDLNSIKYPYAGYMDRIRRQVNYWWQQNLDNLPSSVRLSKSKYTTEVSVILNADGALEHIEVTAEAGVPELDDAVVRAFRLAAPFDNPPDGLVQKDGRVYLPDFDFTVQLSAASMQYQGIDPRAGVQFPGILKSPR